MLRLTALACLCAIGELANADVTVLKSDYKGWKDCYTISNGVVDLVVVPQIGRVMRYGFVGGPNVLWENSSLSGLTFAPDPQTYRDYGGDKLWIAPQSLWNWPPDTLTDGQKWTVENIPNGVRMTSPVAGRIKVQFKREITMKDFGSEVTFQNSMQNLGPQRELGVWQSTQIDDPDSAMLGIATTPSQSKGWYGFGRESLDPKFYQQLGSSLIIHRNLTESRRFGAQSPSGIITAIKSSLTFTSQSKVFPQANYPDHGSAQEVQTSANPYAYVQLSQFSPLSRLERNEVSLQTVVWNLTKS